MAEDRKLLVKRQRTSLIVHGTASSMGINMFMSVTLAASSQTLGETRSSQTHVWNSLLHWRNTEHGKATWCLAWNKTFLNPQKPSYVNTVVQNKSLQRFATWAHKYDTQAIQCPMKDILSVSIANWNPVLEGDMCGLQWEVQSISLQLYDNLLKKI